MKRILLTIALGLGLLTAQAQIIAVTPINKSASETFDLVRIEIEVQSPSITLMSNWLLGKLNFSSFESIRVISCDSKDNSLAR